MKKELNQLFAGKPVKFVEAVYSKLNEKRDLILKNKVKIFQDEIVKSFGLKPINESSKDDRKISVTIKYETDLGKKGEKTFEISTNNESDAANQAYNKFEKWAKETKQSPITKKMAHINESSEDAEKEAYKAGRKANQDGYLLDDNPYEEENLADAWGRGFAIDDKNADLEDDGKINNSDDETKKLSEAQNGDPNYSNDVGETDGQQAMIKGNPKVKDEDNDKIMKDIEDGDNEDEDVGKKLTESVRKILEQSK